MTKLLDVLKLFHGSLSYSSTFRTIIFWNRILSSWIGLFCIGIQFFSLVTSQSGSKGITEPYKGISGKTYTAKKNREEHLV